MSTGNGGGVNHLDTSEFQNAISAFKSGISDYNALKSEVETATNSLFTQWEGEGKVQFEKNYNTLYRQLSDIADVMYELYEALIDAEAAYIQADLDTAKMLTIE